MKRLFIIIICIFVLTVNVSCFNNKITEIKIYGDQTVKLKEYIELIAITLPGNLENSEVVWSSSNNSIAEVVTCDSPKLIGGSKAKIFVDRKCIKVLGKSLGNVVITAKSVANPKVFEIYKIEVVTTE